MRTSRSKGNNDCFGSDLTVAGSVNALLINLRSVAKTLKKVLAKTNLVRIIRIPRFEALPSPSSLKR